MHSMAVEDQQEAAQIMDEHHRVDSAAVAAGSISAVADEMQELIDAERSHSERVERHAVEESRLIDEHRSEVRSRSDHE